MDFPPGWAVTAFTKRQGDTAMGKQQGLFKRIGGCLILFFLLSNILTACGRLPSTYEVKSEIRQALPEAVVLDVESGRRSGTDYKYKKYTIDNKGIVFTYENYQGQNSMFGLKTAFAENNYCEKLFEHFQEDIDKIVEKYHVELKVRDSYVWITNSISHMNDIDHGIDAMEEIWGLIEDYIPETTAYWFEFSIYLDTANFGKSQNILIEKKDDWDASYYRQLLYMNLKDAAEQGMATKVEMPQELLDAIPQKYIRNLYINGEPYHSDRYEIRFLYNIKDGRYYTPVGFGIELDYNGGVEDYLQREIIEFYYPEAEYTISTKEQISTYNIGNDHYRIKRKKDGLVFLKNGKELPIVHETEISDTHPGADYYYWVSVDDFALLLGMSVDKVDDSGVYLLLP
ncbi:MAG: hypothetical protein HFF17_14825 [Oscillospiraceae bacterium]|nr:hypothetical protein [Oscillospiraceae bacterium]